MKSTTFFFVGDFAVNACKQIEIAAFLTKCCEIVYVFFVAYFAANSCLALF